MDGANANLVNSLVTDKTNLFRNATDPDASVLPDEQAAFESFLRNNICNEVKNLSKKLFDIKHKKKTVPPDWGNLCPKTEESDYEQNESNSQISKPDLFYNCNNHKTQFFCEVEKLIGSYSVNYDRANKSESSSSYIEYLKKNFPPKKLVILLNSTKTINELVFLMLRTSLYLNWFITTAKPVSLFPTYLHLMNSREMGKFHRLFTA